MRWYLRIKTDNGINNGYIETTDNEQEIISKIYNEHKYIKLENNEAKATVKIPETAIARLLIAPSTSPISRAFAVPIA